MANKIKFPLQVKLQCVINAPCSFFLFFFKANKKWNLIVTHVTMQKITGKCANILPSLVMRKKWGELRELTWWTAIKKKQQCNQHNSVVIQKIAWLHSKQNRRPCSVRICNDSATSSAAPVSCYLLAWQYNHLTCIFIIVGKPQRAGSSQGQSSPIYKM